MRPRDRGDAAMSESIRCRIAWSAPEEFAAETVGTGPSMRPARVDDDEAKAMLHQRLELTGGLLGKDEQTAVDGSVDEAFEQRYLPIVVVERRAEHDSHVVLVEGVGDPGHDVREIGGVDPRHGHPDQAGPSVERARAALFAV